LRDGFGNINFRLNMEARFFRILRSNPRVSILKS
jgi:hypothetical protein